LHLPAEHKTKWSAQLDNGYLTQGKLLKVHAFDEKLTKLGQHVAVTNLKIEFKQFFFFKCSVFLPVWWALLMFIKLPGTF
jgi:hypothetical protein